MQTSSHPEPLVVHEPQHQRFVAEVSGHQCVADYRLQGKVMQMVHTGVHPSLQGQGIAAKLVVAALAHARENELRIDPVCSYVRVYMDRHPETADLRA